MNFLREIINDHFSRHAQLFADFLNENYVPAAGGWIKKDEASGNPSDYFDSTETAYEAFIEVMQAKYQQGG